MFGGYNMFPGMMPAMQTNFLPPMFPGGNQKVQLIEPFVVKALENAIGKDLIVETTTTQLRGKLEDVKEDHIVLKDNKKRYFIRIQEIVYVSPA